MNLRMGGQFFANVDIPLLWGTRAVVSDRSDRLSIINLEGSEAKLEILGDQPAADIEFRPLSGGAVEILDNHVALYTFDASSKTLRGIKLKLPECMIEANGIRIGTNYFSNNTVVGAGVGLVVSEHGMGMGAPLPPNLARLRV